MCCAAASCANFVCLLRASEGLLTSVLSLPFRARLISGLRGGTRNPLPDVSDCWRGDWLAPFSTPLTATINLGTLPARCALNQTSMPCCWACKPARMPLYMLHTCLYVYTPCTLTPHSLGFQYTPFVQFSGGLGDDSRHAPPACACCSLHLCTNTSFGVWLLQACRTVCACEGALCFQLQFGVCRALPALLGSLAYVGCHIMWHARLAS